VLILKGLECTKIAQNENTLRVVISKSLVVSVGGILTSRPGQDRRGSRRIGRARAGGALRWRREWARTIKGQGSTRVNACQG
jgi:hypothetical protein